jgi:hypothetical protein
MISYEISYKFQLYFGKGIKFSLNNIKTPNENATGLDNLKPKNYIVSTSSQTDALITEARTQNNPDETILIFIPFSTHLLRLNVTYMLSFGFLLLASFPIFAFAMSQYKKSFSKLQDSFFHYIKNNQCKNRDNLLKNEESTNYYYSEYANPEYCESKMEKDDANNSNSSDYGLLNDKLLNGDAQKLDCLKNSTLNDSLKDMLTIKAVNEKNEDSNTKHLSCKAMPKSVYESLVNFGNFSKFMKAPNKSSNERSFFKKHRSSLASFTSSSFVNILSLYKLHLIALFVLLVIFVNFVYVFLDNIFLFKLSSDKLLLYAAAMQIIYFVFYLILWLVFTFKTELNFKFDHEFKLKYWYLINKVVLSYEQEQSKKANILKLNKNERDQDRISMTYTKLNSVENQRLMPSSYSSSNIFTEIQGLTLKNQYDNNLYKKFDASKDNFQEELTSLLNDGCKMDGSVNEKIAQFKDENKSAFKIHENITNSFTDISSTDQKFRNSSSSFFNIKNEVSSEQLSVNMANKGEPASKTASNAFLNEKKVCLYENCDEGSLRKKPTTLSKKISLDNRKYKSAILTSSNDSLKCADQNMNGSPIERATEARNSVASMSINSLKPDQNVDKLKLDRFQMNLNELIKSKNHKNTIKLYQNHLRREAKLKTANRKNAYLSENGINMNNSLIVEMENAKRQSVLSNKIDTANLSSENQKLAKNIKPISFQLNLTDNLNESNRRLIEKILIKQKESVSLNSPNKINTRISGKTVMTANKPSFTANTTTAICINGHETDSGRHSMADSPSSALHSTQTDSTDEQRNTTRNFNNKIKVISKPNEFAINAGACGSFSSRCIFSTGKMHSFRTTDQDSINTNETNNKLNENEFNLKNKSKSINLSEF